MAGSTPIAPSRERLLFLDALRGLALVFMALNHTSRWWIDLSMGWPRYYLVYVTVTVAAPLFLFLVGFCLPLSPWISWGAAARKYLRRGLGLILAGFVLNALVFPEDPFWSGGVLQTIGLGILVSLPAAWLLRYGPARYGLLALAVLQYVAFSWSYPRLNEWLPAHPVIAKIWFWEFPPWPWVGLVLVGLVFGQIWTERVDRRDRARYIVILAAAGVLCVLWFLAYDWWAGSAHRMSFKRDFILNRHWTPRGATNAWIMGVLFSLLAVGYYVLEVRPHRLPWLETLGRTAFVLYFLHQLIALTLINQLLGLRFNNWWVYALANVLFVALLVGMGRGWLETKRIFGDRITLARFPWPHRSGR